MRPYVRGAISRLPYPPSVENIDYGNDTYRLIPIQLRLNFDDEHNTTTRTGPSKSHISLQKYRMSITDKRLQERIDTNKQHSRFVSEILSAIFISSFLSTQYCRYCEL